MTRPRQTTSLPGDVPDSQRPLKNQCTLIFLGKEGNDIFDSLLKRPRDMDSMNAWDEGLFFLSVGQKSMPLSKEGSSTIISFLFTQQPGFFSIFRLGVLGHQLFNLGYQIRYPERFRHDIILYKVRQSDIRNRHLGQALMLNRTKDVHSPFLHRAQSGFVHSWHWQ